MSREMWGFFSSTEPDWYSLLPTMAENAVPPQTVLLSCSRKHSWSLYLNILLQPLFLSYSGDIKFPTPKLSAYTVISILSVTKPTLTEMTGFGDSKTWSSFSNAPSLKHLCSHLTGRASDCGATHTFRWPGIQNLRVSANCWWGDRADRSGSLWASLCWVFVITMISYKSRFWRWFLDFEHIGSTRKYDRYHTKLLVRRIWVNPAPPYMASSSQFSCWGVGKMSATALEDSVQD